MKKRTSHKSTAAHTPPSPFPPPKKKIKTHEAGEAGSRDVVPGIGRDAGRTSGVTERTTARTREDCWTTTTAGLKSEALR